MATWLGWTEVTVTPYLALKEEATSWSRGSR
jgi:hypothetical protein